MELLGWDEAVAFLVLVASQVAVVYFVMRCCATRKQRQMSKSELSAKNSEQTATSMLTNVGRDLYACEHELSGSDAPALQRLRVTYVVLVDTSGFGSEDHVLLSRHFYVLQICAFDVSSFVLSDRFHEVSQFIKSAHMSNGAAVISGGGGSFSIAATLVLANSMIADKMCLRDAFTQLDRLRPLDSLNLGFWRQLEQLESDLQLGGAERVEVSLPLQEAAVHVLRRAADGRVDSAVVAQLVEQVLSQRSDGTLPEWWELAELNEQISCIGTHES
uniref:Uncharacterized protein n=1 Tax=Chrysotila carterae TaxID=13221 RepID=A0A7S4B3P2_CHRCT